MARNTRFYFVAEMGGKGINATVRDNQDGSADVVTYPGGTVLKCDPETLMVRSVGKAHAQAVAGSYQRSDHYSLSRLDTISASHRSASMTLAAFITTGPLVVNTDEGLALLDALKVSNAFSESELQTIRELGL